MEFEFAVGETDRHQIHFGYRRLANSVRISVDGKLVDRDTFWIWIPASRKYEFNVGKTEPHQVEIDATFPRQGAKFSNPSCRVLVDGQFVREY